MRLAQKASFEFYEQEASTNPEFRKLYQNWRLFRERQFRLASGCRAYLCEFCLHNAGAARRTVWVIRD